MSETTNLKLFKHNEPLETNENQFDVDLALNQNWDKIDDAYGNLNTDIENLQTNDTKQDELISKLKNALINVETEESKSIHVEDASTIGQLEVLGNHEQKTRDGYNILPNNLTNTTINGVTFTINEDKSVTVNGTATASIIANLITGEYNDNNATEPLIIPDNITNCRLSGCPSGGSSSTYKLDIYNQKYALLATDWGEGTNVTIDSQEDKKIARVRIIIYSGATVNNLTFKPMLVAGTEEKPYEQYGASPSLNYLSEVVCLGSNKQLFNKDQSTIEKGSINMDGTFTNSNTRIRVYDISLKGNKTYTVSSKDNNLNIVPYFYDEEGTFISYLNGWKTLPFTFKMPNNAKILKLLFRNKSDTEITAEDILNADIKIEEGTEATPYSPPGQGSTLINKINKNRFNKNTAIQGYRLDPLGEYYVQSNYFTSEYISVKSLTYYAVNYSVAGAMQRICFYDKNKNFISANISSNVFQTPENCKYIKICNELTYLNETQIEEGKTSTEYIEHQQTDYLLYIQQEMLQGDYFVKEADGWKEAHGIIKIVIDGVNTKVRNLKLIANSTMIQFAVDSEKALNKNGIAVSNCFRQSKNWSVINTVVISDLGTLYFHCKSDVISEITNDAMNALLQQMYEQGNPLICYATATNSEKLTCTKEQSAVLEELNNLDLFEGVNNIITAEDIALLKLKYALDVKTYVDNQLANVNAQILNIAGGN